jgi:enoyl-CoA hydratase/carnithine racemase
MARQYSEATLDRDGVVATLTQNGPEKLNAFGPKVEKDIRAAIAEGDHDPSVRVLIITGAGRAFSAGADVKAHPRVGLSPAGAAGGAPAAPVSHRPSSIGLGIVFTIDSIGADFEGGDLGVQGIGMFLRLTRRVAR